MQQLTIGEIAHHAGLNTSAIRYYERVGLLPKPARVGGQRRYDRDVLNRLSLVQMAQEAGFTIAEIKTLINGFSEDTPPADRWQELARRKIPEINALIQRMLTVRQVLEESLQCDCLTLDACANQGWAIPAGSHLADAIRPDRIPG